MNKKVLVTGGFGFIGHEVVRQFESLGYEVCIIDLLTDYQGAIPRQELNDLIVERRKSINTSNWYQIDVANANDVNWAFDRFKPNIVVHLASTPRQQVVEADVPTAVNTMVTGTHNVIRASEAAGADKFVFISSSMVYGNIEYPAHESAVCQPNTTYGILKYAGEQLTKASRLNYAIVRPSAVYGARDVSGRVISKFFEAAMKQEPIKVQGIGERLDFTYVTDIAHGIVQAAVVENTNETFNITFGGARTLLEAAETVLEIVGLSNDIDIVDRNKNFPIRGTLSIARAQELIGYYPQVSLEEGLETYYEWLNTFYRT